MSGKTPGPEQHDSPGSVDSGYVHRDIRFMDAPSLSEPVTPPTSGNSHPFYAKSHYISHGKQPQGNSTSQLSPNMVLREHATLAGMPASTFLASPVETAGLAPQSYLSTPHTPKQSCGNSHIFNSTPLGPIGVAPAHSRQSSSGTIMTPLNHARSYSYSLVDPQTSLSRLSLGSQPSSMTAVSGTSPSSDTTRPRAYSFGISGHPFGVDSHAFPAPPAPLSSPISPDKLMTSGGPAATAGSTGSSSSGMTRLAQRPYSHHTFASGDDHFVVQQSPKPLYRSMSSASMKTPAFGGSSSCSSLGSIGMPISTELPSLKSASSTASTASSTAAATSAKPFRPRRSSSSSSSDLTPVVFGPAVLKEAPLVEIEMCTDSEIYALCRDQRGCRYLQRKLSESNPAIVKRIFNATYPHVVSLMVDPFGNYFCQKLFELCDESEILTLLTVSAQALPYIATNQHGTRALQRLIDAVSTGDHLQIIVNALDGHVVRLIRDINGNHVIQKLLLTLDESGSQFIYDAVCESVVEIGSHRHGCCVLQRCLDYAKERNRQKLVAHIVAQAPILVCDPFGNYVCQYVIDLGVQEFTDSLVEQLLGRIATLSVQKFSSNVVEKCLREASPPLQQALVAELMVPKTLNELLLDNYGNYVIQTALEAMSNVDAAQKQVLSRDICAALNVTRSPYGRRIMSKLKAW